MELLPSLYVLWVVESMYQLLEDSMTEVVIVDAIRTPIGALGGIL